MLGPRQRFDLRPRRFELEGMHCALPRHDDAVAAQGNLRDDIGTTVVLRDHRADLFLKRHFLGDGL